MTNHAGAVQLFGTCLIEAFRPQAGLAAVTVLEKLGLTVAYPTGQTCCGQPAFNAGAWNEARRMARHTLAVFAHSPSPIVIPSGSCAEMLIHHYPRLLADDPQYGRLAQAIAERTYEFTQFIVEVLGHTDLGARFTGTITYHPSCHLLHGLHLAGPPRQLLANVRGATVAELPGAAECCGFGGLFAVRMGGVSGAMLNRKLDHIESTGATTVVACDMGCLLHIGGGLHRRRSPIAAQHLAELLVHPGE